MKIEELVKKLKDLEKTCINETYKWYDAEKGHMEADQLLLQYINNPEVTEAFNDLEKWYS